MKKYNEYLKRVDEAARLAFDGFNAADKALREINKEYEEAGKVPHDPANIAEQRKRLDLKERQDNAQTVYTEALHALQKCRDEIAGIRTELVDTLDRDYAANPEAVDEKTMMLLSSGILKRSDYERLMENAERADNYTMMRLIASYADREADELEKRNGKDDADVKALIRIVNEAANNPANSYLRTFDTVSDVYKRCSENPAMIDHWDELTGELIDEK